MQAFGIKPWILFGTRSAHKGIIVMISYQSTLIGRTEVAESTMAFQFEKPKGLYSSPGSISTWLY